MHSIAQPYETIFRLDYRKTVLYTCAVYFCAIDNPVSQRKTRPRKDFGVSGGVLTIMAEVAVKGDSGSEVLVSLGHETKLHIFR